MQGMQDKKKMPEKQGRGIKFDFKNGIDFHKLTEVLISVLVIAAAAGAYLTISKNDDIQFTPKQKDEYIQKHKDEFVSKLQNTYRILEFASDQILKKDGFPEKREDWQKSADEVFSLYKKYVKDASSCYKGESCMKHMNDKGWHFLNAANEGALKSSTSWYMTDSRYLVLKDGVQLIFTGAGEVCKKTPDSPFKACAKIYADVNGSKNPNTLGRDIFEFIFTDDGLHPSGCGYDDCKIEENAENSDGSGCTCRVISEGAMNY